jgi:hypothetical protein
MSVIWVARVATDAATDVALAAILVELETRERAEEAMLEAEAARDVALADRELALDAMLEALELREEALDAMLEAEAVRDAAAAAIVEADAVREDAAVVMIPTCVVSSPTCVVRLASVPANDVFSELNVARAAEKQSGTTPTLVAVVMTRFESSLPKASTARTPHV